MIETLCYEKVTWGPPKLPKSFISNKLCLKFIWFLSCIVVERWYYSDMSDSSNYNTYWMDTFYPHYTGVPEFTKLSLVNYLVYGYHPGSGLTSILKSDVEGCSLFLDKENKKHFFTIVAWLRSYAPEGSWGSSKNVENWIQSKREERGKEAM